MIKQVSIMTLEELESKDQKLVFECAECHKTIDGVGLFYYVKEDNQTFYFDHYRCRYNFKSRYQTILKKRLVQLQRTILCVRCSTVFVGRPTQRYCSKTCAIRSRPLKYHKYNWCDLCREWILKKDSIHVPKGTKKQHKHQSKEYISKKDRYFCPKCKGPIRTNRKRNYNNNNDRNKKQE